MAILKPTLGILLASLLLLACENVPVTSTSTRRVEDYTPRVHEDIAWSDRQFRICGGRHCPAPTHKTLALLELPVTAPIAPAPVQDVSQTATPTVIPEDSPVATIHFQFAKSVPTAAGRRALQRLAEIAPHYESIELQGRTDDLGGKATNDTLARQRAQFVRAWLVEHGIQAEIVVRSEGLCCYLDTTPSEAARQSNRRVEVRLAGRRDAVSNLNGSAVK